MYVDLAVRKKCNFVYIGKLTGRYGLDSSKWFFDPLNWYIIFSPC